VRALVSHTAARRRFSRDYTVRVSV
jgi:hypothetical protein